MWTSWAYAAEGAASGGSSIGSLLFLIGVVSAAYLVAHVVLERAQQRFLFVSGIEYVGLGIVLGPSVVPDHAQPFGDLSRLAPIFAFTAGWVGLLHGLELRARWPQGGGRPARIALVDAAITGGSTFALAFAVLGSGVVPGVSPEAARAGALALAAAATAGSTSAIELLQSRYRGLETVLLPTLRRSIRGGNLISFVAFGALFCAFHPDRALAAVAPTPLGWALVTVGLGVVLGAVFFLFLGRDASPSHLFLAMVGTLLFASGAATFLHVSALLVNLVLGAVLAQTPIGARISAELRRTDRPATLVLLLFAGALWRPVPWVPGALSVVGYLLVRLVAKSLASAIATLGTSLRTDLYRGLLAQGQVAVAMAVSYRLFYEGPAVDLVYTAILFGTVLSELGSPRQLRGLLADAGELREDLGPARAGLAGPSPGAVAPVEA